MAKFHERLRLLRKESGLSQQEFANLLGSVSKSSINMYERGEREPSLETLEDIADFFNVDLDYLLGKSNIPNRNDASRLMSPEGWKDFTDKFFSKLDIVIGILLLERTILLTIADVLGEDVDLSNSEAITPDNYLSIQEKMMDFTESLHKKVSSVSFSKDEEDQLVPLFQFYTEILLIKEKLFQLLEESKKKREQLPKKSDNATSSEGDVPSVDSSKN